MRASDKEALTDQMERLEVGDAVIFSARGVTHIFRKTADGVVRYDNVQRMTYSQERGKSPSLTIEETLPGHKKCASIETPEM